MRRFTAIAAVALAMSVITVAQGALSLPCR